MVFLYRRVKLWPTVTTVKKIYKIIKKKMEKFQEFSKKNMVKLMKDDKSNVMHCTHCGSQGQSNFRKDEGKIDSKWGMTAFGVVIMTCNQCGHVELFNKGRTIFDID